MGEYKNGCPILFNATIKRLVNIVIIVAITANYLSKQGVGFRLHTSTCVFQSINILAVNI